MSRHAGPPRAADAPSIPEPTFAERARTLAYLGLTGALATLSRRHPGHPFASVMPYALDAAGAPLFLISTMAMHTQNLEADARASLLITQPGWSGDPLAAERARRVPVRGDDGRAEPRGLDRDAEGRSRGALRLRRPARGWCAAGARAARASRRGARRRTARGIPVARYTETSRGTPSTAP